MDRSRKNINNNVDNIVVYCSLLPVSSNVNEMFAHDNDERRESGNKCSKLYVYVPGDTSNESANQTISYDTF